MTEAQQYALGTYVNLMSSSTQLLVNPIIGLKPKYSREELAHTISKNTLSTFSDKQLNLIVTIANLLHNISHDSKDGKLLIKAFRNNKKFRKLMELTKKDIDDTIIITAEKLISSNAKQP